MKLDGARVQLRRGSLCAAVALAACAHDPFRVTPNIDTSILDRSVAPCDDFYRFACHQWIENPRLQHGQDWVRGFATAGLHDQVVILAEMSAAAEGQGDSANPETRRIGDFLYSCMHESRVKTSMGDLRPELLALEAVRDPDGLARAVAHLHDEGISAFFAFGPTEDSTGDASQVIAELNQGGLSLADVTVYRRDDPSSTREREALATRIAAALTRAGESLEEGRQHAEAVLQIEAALAKSSLARVDARDPANRTHRMSWDDVGALAPAFAWKTWRAERSPFAKTPVNVAVPAFFSGLNRVLSETPYSDLRAYLRWRLLAALTPSLAHDFVHRSWGYDRYEAEGLGTRFGRCASTVEGLLAEPIGRTFVGEALSSDARAHNLARLEAVEAALGRRLDSLSWMDEPTKVEARRKLAQLKKQVGYPSAWLRYDGLEIDPHDYVGNLRRVRRFRVLDALARIGQPIDDSDWTLPPQASNALYDPVRNEMLFPAGILQPPFFNPASTEAVNSGALGAVIGHELTHGFDDIGRKYDGRGLIRDWWTPASSAAFEQRAECLVSQFNRYHAAKEVFLDGRLTLGENIADLGGVTLAYDAFEATKPVDAAPVDGFTPEQQFFLSYAQVWCERQTENHAKGRVNVDPHAPGRFRVNGPLSNLPAFHAAFGCKDGDKMVRPEAERCSIW